MSDKHLDGLKLEPFWLDDPALWFAQTEAKFWNLNVKDDVTKFNYVITQLDKHCLTVVKDVVLSPPIDNKYKALKSALLKRLKENRVKNIKEILMAVEIGERKPSEFLRHLKDLAGEDFDEEYIKSVWSSNLPAKVQWVTSFLPSSSLTKISQLADLALNSPSVVCRENKLQPTKPIIETKTVATDDVKELTKRVEQISLKVEELESTSNKNEDQQTLSKPTQFPGGTTNTTSTLSLFSQESGYNQPKRPYPYVPILCWYHTQFGWSATKCTHPCNFRLKYFGI